MSELTVAVCSIAPTRRRRFMWVAWRTGMPSREPFTRPDVWSGGGKTPAAPWPDTRRAACPSPVGVRPVRAIARGRLPLRPPPGPPWLRLVGAGPVRAIPWGRLRVAQPPWPTPGAPRPPTALPDRSNAISIWETLGIPDDASADDLKRAYRSRALVTHPDRGGDPAEFRRLQRAYEVAQGRVGRPRPKR